MRHLVFLGLKFCKANTVQIKIIYQNVIMMFGFKLKQTIIGNKY